jgi:hypothetical protein
VCDLDKQALKDQQAHPGHAISDIMDAVVRMMMSFACFYCVLMSQHSVILVSHAMFRRRFMCCKDPRQQSLAAYIIVSRVLRAVIPCALSRVMSSSSASSSESDCDNEVTKRTVAGDARKKQHKRAKQARGKPRDRRRDSMNQARRKSECGSSPNPKKRKQPSSDNLPAQTMIARSIPSPDSSITTTTNAPVPDPDYPEAISLPSAEIEISPSNTTLYVPSFTAVDDPDIPENSMHINQESMSSLSLEALDAPESIQLADPDSPPPTESIQTEVINPVSVTMTINSVSPSPSSDNLPETPFVDVNTNTNIITTGVTSQVQEYTTNLPSIVEHHVDPGQLSDSDDELGSDSEDVDCASRSGVERDTYSDSEPESDDLPAQCDDLSDQPHLEESGAFVTASDPPSPDPALLEDVFLQSISPAFGPPSCIAAEESTRLSASAIIEDLLEDFW